MTISGKKDINRAELAAIYMGLLLAGPDVLSVHTDSATALNLLKGSLCIEKYSMLVFAIKSITAVKYNGIVKYNKVKAHSGVRGNDIADALARHAALISPSQT